MAPIDELTDEELLNLSAAQLEALVDGMSFDIPPYPEAKDRDLEEKYRVEWNEELDNVIVVDGVPKITPEKETKLRGVLAKFFQGIPGARLKEGAENNGIYMPYGPDPQNPAIQLSKGFIFVEFETAQEAAIAAKAADGHSLDKSHVFSAHLFSDIERYTSMPDTFVPPAQEDHKDRPPLRTWLTDPDGRDQFVLRFGDETRVCWNMKHEEPEIAHSRVKWSDSFVSWSPRGSYLATYHDQGVALWGGAEWKVKLIRFKHPGVKYAVFSPMETYMVTIGGTDERRKEPNMLVWDARTGELLRSFSTVGVANPTLKWSFDDKYVAQQGENCVRIYELPQMKLLNKKKLDVDGVQDFQWSPSQNLISYWTPETRTGNVPARVTIIDVPSLSIVRADNIFNVINVEMIWQKAGDYLACSVERKKSKIQNFCSFEIFRLREKGVPVEALETEVESITKFAWEPEGRLFCFISGEAPSHTVHFYEMEEKQIKLVKTLERRNVSTVIWSPRGEVCLLAGIGSKYNGLLEFWHYAANSMEMMESTEHFLITDAEWDPSGRFVTTYVSYTRQQHENGYNIWDFRGKLLFRQTFEKLLQFLWRPRPPSLLTKEQKQHIRSNLKKYASEFRKIDESASSKEWQALMQRRRQQMETWQEYIKGWQKQYAHEAMRRKELRGGYDDQADDAENVTMVEEIVEELIYDSRNANLQ